MRALRNALPRRAARDYHTLEKGVISNSQVSEHNLMSPPERLLRSALR